MVCKKCGNEMENGKKYCSKCDASKFGVGTKIWIIACLVIGVITLVTSIYFFHWGVTREVFGGFYFFTAVLGLLSIAASVSLLKFKKLGIYFVYIAAVLGLVFLDLYAYVVSISYASIDKNLISSFAMQGDPDLFVKMMFDDVTNMGDLVNEISTFIKFSMIFIVTSCTWTIISSFLTKIFTNSKKSNLN